MAASLNVVDQNKKKTLNENILSVSPLQKQAAMSKGQIKSAVSRKRAAGNVGPKPTNVKTIVKKKKLAEKIKDDVINWSKNVLEPMNKHLGFPACPFAAKWRRENKLRIEVRPDRSKYEKHLTRFLKIGTRNNTT